MPIGFDGVLLENLPAPISFLQGFNVVGPSGLNNIIAIINDEFSLSFPAFFDDEFYSDNVNAASEDSPELLDYVHKIQIDFRHQVSLDEAAVERRPDWAERLQSILHEANLPFSADEARGSLTGPGFTVTGLKSRTGEGATVPIDPLALNSTRDLWATVNASLYAKKLPNTIYRVILLLGRQLPADDSLISGRLPGSEVSTDPEYPFALYSFRNIKFRVDSMSRAHTPDRHASFSLIVPNDNLQPIPALSLLRLLAHRRVLT